MSYADDVTALKKTGGWGETKQAFADYPAPSPTRSAAKPRVGGLAPGG